MCGIYGKAASAPFATSDVVARNDRLLHRGPDGAGLVIFSREPVETGAAANYDLVRRIASNSQFDVAMAHRRLAIVDPKGGVQPMCNEDGTVWVTFNGEIYNFQTIRRELESAGHQFVSDHSDTEVIIHAWEEWGGDCLARFNGMFAFAIYDANRQVIFFARDRVGKKPFYYRSGPGLFEFASEIQALDTKRELEPQAVNFFLGLGYIPGKLSLFKDVAKLPPAHAGLIDLRTWNLKVWPYWALPSPVKSSSRKEDDLVDELEALLLDAVSLRLISDVPLGVFLSGGLDSSLVAAMAAKTAGRALKTFTIAFPGAGRYDEAPYATAVANHIGSDHTELTADDDSLQSLAEVLASMGEPLGDSSLLPTWMVSKLSRRHVTVALGGDGGDELFGGYGHHRSVLDNVRRFAAVPNLVWKLLGLVAEHMPPGMKGRNLLYSMKGSPKNSGVWSTSFFSPAMRRKLMGSDMRAVLLGRWEEPEQWRQSLMNDNWALLDQLTRMDFLSYLPEDILVKVDRASMMNSLEVRAPWLDYRLVEFAYGQVPASMKVRNGSGKWLPKQLAVRLLPKDFPIERKQGFSMPLDRWFTSDRRGTFRKHLPTNEALFSQSEIDRLVEGEYKGRANSARLFALMCMRYSAF